MHDTALTDNELMFIDKILAKYSNEESIINASELDGFLTAIASGPETILPSRWFAEIWGGEDKLPDWNDIKEYENFFGLLAKQMNNNITMLMDHPDEFRALFEQAEYKGEIVFFSESWCLGYMAGVELGGGWQGMPQRMSKNLALIAMRTDKETLEETPKETLQLAVAQIETAASALHGYWLNQRSAEIEAPAPITAEPKIGRNDPCPCGSGKKFKKCCLH